MSFVTRAMAAGMIVLGMAGTARADVLYNNMVTNSQGVEYFDQQTPNAIGASFNTDSAANLDLTAVQLWLGGGGIAGSSLVVTIQTDNSGSPGPTVLASWTVSDAALTSYGAYQFNLTTPAALSADTTYWVMAQDTGGSTAWFYTSPTNGSPQTGPGQIPNQSFYVDDTVLSNSGQGQAQEMCVLTGGSACSPTDATLIASYDQSAPEPASLAILGVAVIGLGVARRYKKI